MSLIRQRPFVVLAGAVAARHGKRVAGDGTVDLDAVAGAQRGVELDQLVEDADLLRIEVDGREIGRASCRERVS
jgi:hypothetical protein